MQYFGVILFGVRCIAVIGIYRPLKNQKERSEDHFRRRVEKSPRKSVRNGALRPLLMTQ